MVTIRSSSSEVISPALRRHVRNECEGDDSEANSGRYVPFVEIDVGLFAHQIGVSAHYTLDLGEGVHDLNIVC